MNWICDLFYFLLFSFQLYARWANVICSLKWYDVFPVIQWDGHHIQVWVKKSVAFSINMEGSLIFTIFYKAIKNRNKETKLFTTKLSGICGVEYHQLYDKAAMYLLKLFFNQSQLFPSNKWKLLLEYNRLPINHPPVSKTSVSHQKVQK